MNVILLTYAKCKKPYIRIYYFTDRVTGLCFILQPMARIRAKVFNRMQFTSSRAMHTVGVFNLQIKLQALLHSATDGMAHKNQCCSSHTCSFAFSIAPCHKNRAVRTLKLISMYISAQFSVVVEVTMVTNYFVYWDGNKHQNLGVSAGQCRAMTSAPHSQYDGTCCQQLSDTLQP